MRKILLAWVLFTAANALAQPYPSKPIRVAVAFPPGGPVDIIARLMGPKLGELLGQSIVVENVVGAGGNVAAVRVAKAASDGYTVLAHSSAYAVNPTLIPNAGYDGEKDFIPLAIVASQPNLIVVHADFPAKTLAELLELAKREKLSYASGGPGVPGHLAAELLLSMTGASMLHVPYKGPAAATADVMGGQVNCGFLATPTVLPHVKSGKLKGLAVSTAKRSPLAPDIPAAAEAGAPGFDAPFYLVLFTQKGTPADITALMNREVSKALGDPALKERAAALDIVTLGGSPEEATRVLKAAAAKWAPVVQRIGLKLD